MDESTSCYQQDEAVLVMKGGPRCHTVQLPIHRDQVRQAFVTRKVSEWSKAQFRHGKQQRQKWDRCKPGLLCVLEWLHFRTISLWKTEQKRPLLQQEKTGMLENVRKFTWDIVFERWSEKMQDFHFDLTRTYCWNYGKHTKQQTEDNQQPKSPYLQMTSIQYLDYIF